MSEALLPRAVVVAILLGQFPLEIFDHAGPFPTNAAGVHPAINGQPCRAGGGFPRDTWM